jgi:hypothetical protein
LCCSGQLRNIRSGKDVDTVILKTTNKNVWHAAPKLQRKKELKKNLSKWRQKERRKTEKTGNHS